jgi:sortase (surface protein transpeptidase)
MRRFLSNVKRAVSPWVGYLVVLASIATVAYASYMYVGGFRGYGSGFSQQQNYATGFVNQTFTNNDQVSSLYEDEISMRANYLEYAAPLALSIPSLGINEVPITPLTINEGTLEVPDQAYQAGWYKDSPAPGELGPAIVVGHYDWEDGPALFINLHAIQIGQFIHIIRDDQTEVKFVVSDVKQYDRKYIPAEQTYGNSDYAGLRLMTCAGYFDKDLNSYSDNIIVYAQLIE